MLQYHYVFMFEKAGSEKCVLCLGPSSLSLEVVGKSVLNLCSWFYGNLLFHTLQEHICSLHCEALGVF